MKKKKRGKIIQLRRENFEIAAAFNERFALIFENNHDAARSFKERNYDWFISVGMQQRLKFLDRSEDGFELLSENDLDFLFAMGQLERTPYSVSPLNDAKMTQILNWQEASDLERWIGLSLYCELGVIGGLFSSKEAVFFFEICCHIQGAAIYGVFDKDYQSNFTNSNFDHNKKTSDEGKATAIIDESLNYEKYKTDFARAGANALHNSEKGFRLRKEKIVEIWNSGKYSSRDICAEQECAALEMSFSTARKALRNTPEPKKN